MPKKNISSIELTALIHELQILVKGKIPHIYHQEDKELLLQFHVPNQGKQLLKIIPGKWLCLTKIKESAIRPSGFCMLLRKYLDNAFVKSISQKDSERIVIFELEKKEKFHLIIELFSKGNIILTNEQYIIIGALEKQEWKDRSIKPGEKYLLPPATMGWKTITEKELKSLLQQSEKRNLATALATDLGLGGVYAEEVCLRAQISKDLLPSTIGEKVTNALAQSLHDIQKMLEHPHGYITADQITPFPLTQSIIVQETQTYNEAIDTLQVVAKASPYEKRIKSMEHMIHEQEDAIQKQENAILENTKGGELIYEKYQPLQKLLEIVQSMRKTKKWDEIATELKKEKKIKHIDLKTKKIVIDL